MHALCIPDCWPHLSSRSSLWYSSGASDQKWSTKSGNGRLLGKPAQLMRTASSTPAHDSHTPHVQCEQDTAWVAAQEAAACLLSHR
jgi:hypothetical protein